LDVVDAPLPQFSSAIACSAGTFTVAQTPNPNRKQANKQETAQAGKSASGKERKQGRAQAGKSGREH
jgi:hypothetical protein